MHVTRFCRPTVREALAAAREALGPSALVLSTEMVPAPGWRGWMGRRVVRLTAAVDREVSEDRQDASPERPSEPPMDPLRSAAAARLTAAGIDPALAGATARRMSRAACRAGSADALRRALADAFSSLADDNAPVDVPAVEVFVGPPGVGKTTTLAKIAAQERAAGRDPRGFIAADGFRVGAVEHLRGYANIIGAPFRIARDAHELDRALSTSRRPVLVDTAGRSPSDASFRELVAALGRREIVTHLVLAADTSAESAKRLFDAYAPTHPDRVIITKLDEAESAAPLLGVVRSRELPVSFLAAGQRVPEDLARATPAALAALMVGEPAWRAATCH